MRGRVCRCACSINYVHMCSAPAKICSVLLDIHVFLLDIWQPYRTCLSLIGNFSSKSVTFAVYCLCKTDNLLALSESDRAALLNPNTSATTNDSSNPLKLQCVGCPDLLLQPLCDTWEPLTLAQTLQSAVAGMCTYTSIHIHIYKQM